MSVNGAGRPVERKRARIGRRRLLISSAWSSAGLVLAACAGGNGARSSTPAKGSSVKGATASAGAVEQPTHGGTVKLVATNEPDVWDHDATPQAVGVFWDAVAETILSAKKDTYEIAPGFATGWEQPDDRTLILKLPTNAKFHDMEPTRGRAATAEDVKFSLEHGATNNPKFIKRGRYAVIDSMEARGDTLVLHLKEPNAPLVTYLAHQYVLARESVPSGGIILTPKDVPGTGPFMIKSFEPAVGGDMVRSTNYYKGQRLPYLDGVSWSVIADRGALLAAYRTGKVDWGYSTSGGLTGGERTQLQSTNRDIEFKPDPNRYVHWLVFRHDDQKIPYRDLRFRKALHLALDRPQQVTLVAQGSATICGPLSPDLFPIFALPASELLSLPGYRPDKKEDLAEAKKLLAAAEYPDGITIPMDVASPPSDLNTLPGEVAVSQYAKIGVKVEIARTVDLTTYKANEASGDFNLHPSGVSAAPEPDDQLTTRYFSKGARNIGKYANPQVDDLILKQRRAVDANERVKYVLEAQRLLIDDVSHIHIFTLNANSVRQPRVKGIYGTPWVYASGLDRVYIKK